MIWVQQLILLIHNPYYWYCQQFLLLLMSVIYGFHGKISNLSLSSKANCLYKNSMLWCNLINDKVVKNIFWTGAGGPHLIGNFGRFGDTQPLQSSLWGEDLQPPSRKYFSLLYHWLYLLLAFLHFSSKHSLFQIQPKLSKLKDFVMSRLNFSQIFCSLYFTNEFLCKKWINLVMSSTQHENSKSQENWCKL